MAYYGYHRISTKEQHLDRGIIEIKRFCENQKIKLESIFTDKITGKNFDRPRYTVLVEDVLRVGDGPVCMEKLLFWKKPKEEICTKNLMERSLRFRLSRCGL